ncbi:MAG: hypothetical protein WDA25_08295 [Paracoccaceae bacterium]
MTGRVELPALLLAGMGVAAIILGLSVTGGPTQGRMERRDEQRRQDVNALSFQINCLAQNAGNQLPQVIESTDECLFTGRLNDPLTDIPYRYEPLGNHSYRLCAAFETPVRSRWRSDDFNPETGCRHYRLHVTD